MTTTLAVNDNNDIYIASDGNLAESEGLQAVLQTCEQAAKAQQGEMVLNTNRGIPYFNTVWRGVPNIAAFENALRRAFLAVEGVVEVVSLVTSQVDNVLTYNAVIRTIYGGGTVSG